MATILRKGSNPKKPNVHILSIGVSEYPCKGHENDADVPTLKQLKAPVPAAIRFAETMFDGFEREGRESRAR